VSVTSTGTAVGSSGTRHPVVEDLTLPTLADLLAALGLDATALPAGTLRELVDVPDLLPPDLLTTLRTLIDGLGLGTAAQLLGLLDGEARPGRRSPRSAPAGLESAAGSVSSTLTGLTASLALAPSGARGGPLCPPSQTSRAA
jgi:hypothetical protein